MKQYLELMQRILNEGVEKNDRTGTGTISIFGAQMRFDLSKGFPLVTTKKCHLRSIIHELIWFLNGDTNTKYLEDNGVSIWREWQDNNGDLGPVYGKQWRDWVGPNGKHHDQVAKVLSQLRNDPDSRRIIISAWNVGELEEMALAPCHAFMQFYTRELSYDERVQVLCNEHASVYEAIEKKGLDSPLSSNVVIAEMDAAGVPRRELSLQLYQRSADYFLGVCFNIASYTLLAHWMARCVGMTVGEFVWTGGDVHLYSNHLEQAKLQLTRQPKNLPKFVWCTDRVITDPKEVRDTDFEIVGYDPHPAIKAPVAI